MTNTQILVVDDQQDVSQVIKFGLHNLNDTFNISVANDGFEALDVLREAPFDLIITDYMMPGMVSRVNADKKHPRKLFNFQSLVA